MDMLKNITGGGDKNTPQNTQTQQPSSSGGGGGGIMDKLHGVVGGGPESEKKEDALDKGVDWVQENVLKQGPQSNENAIEQAKDEQISDFIRSQYKGVAGKDFPVADK